MLVINNVNWSTRYWMSNNQEAFVPLLNCCIKYQRTGPQSRNLSHRLTSDRRATKSPRLKCNNSLICTCTDTLLQGGSLVCFQNRPISSWQGFNKALETFQFSPCLLKKSITQRLQFYQQDFQPENNLKNLNLN